MNSQFLVALETGLSWWIFIRLINQNDLMGCVLIQMPVMHSRIFISPTEWPAMKVAIANSSCTAPHPLHVHETNLQQLKLDGCLWTWPTLDSRVWLTSLSFCILLRASLHHRALYKGVPHASIQLWASAPCFQMETLIIYHLDYQSCLIYTSLWLNLSAQNSDSMHIINNSILYVHSYDCW